MKQRFNCKRKKLDKKHLTLSFYSFTHHKMQVSLSFSLSPLLSLFGVVREHAKYVEETKKQGRRKTAKKSKTTQLFFNSHRTLSLRCYLFLSLSLCLSLCLSVSLSFSLSLFHSVSLSRRFSLSLSLSLSPLSLSFSLSSLSLSSLSLFLFPYPLDHSLFPSLPSSSS